MANAAVDWTVDKLLSQFQTLNARVYSAQNSIRANRQGYMEALRSLPSIPDPAVREELRTRMREWIHKQVEVENRFTDLAAKWERAKGMVKNFLQRVGITPPAYLGQLILAPAAVWGLVAAGLLLVGVIIALNATQSKALDCITNVTRLASQRGWTADQVRQGLIECKAAAKATTPDPGGLRSTLEAALPLVIVVGALLIFAPMLQRKAQGAT